MSNVPTIRLIFVGTYAEIADQPSGTQGKFQTFGQKYDALPEMAKRLLSIEEGHHNRAGQFVTMEEFATQFPDGSVGDTKGEELLTKKRTLWSLLLQPVSIEPGTTSETEETQKDNG